MLNELPQETIAGIADGGFVRDGVDDESGAVYDLARSFPSTDSRRYAEFADFPIEWSSRRAPRPRPSLPVDRPCATWLRCEGSAPGERNCSPVLSPRVKSARASSSLQARPGRVGASSWMLIPRKKTGFAVEQDLCAADIHRAESYAVCDLISFACDLDRIEFGILRRPERQVGAKGKFGASFGIGLKSLAESRLWNSDGTFC